MNRSCVLSAWRFVASLILAALAAVAAAQEAQPPAKPPEPTRDRRDLLLGATVTEITKTSVSVQESKDQKPRTFAVSETLAAGKVPMKPREIVIPNHRVVPGGLYVPPTFMYRLTDVKVGDRVAIFYAQVGGEDICDHICILKRPGGRVPPLPKEAENLMNPAEMWKAENPGKPLSPFMQEWQDKY